MGQALETKEIPCPPGCKVGELAITTIAIRETNGIDETQAAGQVKARGPSAVYNDEIVRCSIVAVNGEKVQQPWLDYDKANSKLRLFAFGAWRRMNTIGDAEIEDFFGRAKTL